MKKEVKKDWNVLEFGMPINSAITESENMKIKGIAINETTTKNGIKYIAKELKLSAPSFRHKPILLDHRNDVLAIVGRTTENVKFNEFSKSLEFEGYIADEKIQGMINDGRITSVSIGARIKDLKRQDDGSILAVGIEGLEISLVAIPGDENATIASALEECYKLKTGKKAIVFESIEDEEKELKKLKRQAITLAKHIQTDKIKLQIKLN